MSAGAGARAHTPLRTAALPLTLWVCTKSGRRKNGRFTSLRNRAVDILTDAALLIFDMADDLKLRSLAVTFVCLRFFWGWGFWGLIDFGGGSWFCFGRFFWNEFFFGNDSCFFGGLDFGVD